MNEFPGRSIIARIPRLVRISRSLIVDASRVSFVLSVAPLCRFLYSTTGISVRGDSMRLYRSCLKILGRLFRYLSNSELMFYFIRCRDDASCRRSREACESRILFRKYIRPPLPQGSVPCKREIMKNRSYKPRFPHFKIIVDVSLAHLT